jgi:hypothetical protein
MHTVCIILATLLVEILLIWFLLILYALRKDPNIYEGYNIFIGREAGFNFIRGSFNYFIGTRAGYRVMTGSYLVAIWFFPPVQYWGWWKNKSLRKG